MQKEITCMIFRGGTSKGVFFEEGSIPPEGIERDAFLLKVMGSPDLTQIDGLGGATSVTSKVAIIKKSERDDADVDYTFAQVSIDKPVVDYKGNCGNISSAVGPYAIEKEMVKAKDPETVVRIYNTNTNKIIHSCIQTPDGQVSYDGNFGISGVPGTSAPVKLLFQNPEGSVTGKLLPTGNPADLLDIPGFGLLEVSIVDSSNPLVFVRACDIGIKGNELPNQIDGSDDLLKLLETIRGVAAQRLGLVDDYRDSMFKSPAVPKMTIVSKPENYVTASGKIVKSDSIDLIGRMMSMQKAHKTYAFTGALCTASAAVISGTVVNSEVNKSFDAENLRIGHPNGVIIAGVNYKSDALHGTQILWTWGYRTARMIMDGTVYYR